MSCVSAAYREHSSIDFLKCKLFDLDCRSKLQEWVIYKQRNPQLTVLESGKSEMIAPADVVFGGDPRESVCSQGAKWEESLWALFVMGRSSFHS